jgi:hypothetical protein
MRDAFDFPQSHEEHRGRHGHREDARMARCFLQHFIDRDLKEAVRRQSSFTHSEI